MDARVRGDELESDEIKVGEMVNEIFMGRKALARFNFKHTIELCRRQKLGCKRRNGVGNWRFRGEGGRECMRG